MRTYCGINLDTKDFYIGSTTNISRRLKDHEESGRAGERVFWIISDEHDDPERFEEQYYLDFYFRMDKCLNLAGNAKLGDNYGRVFTESHKKAIGQSKIGNTYGSANKGRRFYYDPKTKETKRFIPGTEPEGWKLGSPATSISGYQIWRDANNKRVRVFPGDDTTGLTPPAYKRRDRCGEAFNESRRKKF